MHFGIAGWSSPVARQAHNLKVPGSNPGPATNFQNLQDSLGGFYIGLREDIAVRLAQHHSGISKWTES
jgi:hypothetical protein